MNHWIISHLKQVEIKQCKGAIWPKIKNNAMSANYRKPLKLMI